MVYFIKSWCNLSLPSGENSTSTSGRWQLVLTVTWHQMRLTCVKDTSDCVCSERRVGDPQHFGMKSDHTDTASVWLPATGHSGATLNVISILNVTLSEPITISCLRSPGPCSPFNLTVIQCRGESSQPGSSAVCRCCLLLFYIIYCVTAGH